MKTFFDLLKQIKQNHLQENFFSLLVNGVETKIYYPHFLECVDNLASFFIHSGFQRQDKIVIMMESSPSWLYCDFAITKSGCISVPMFANLSFDNMVYQFENCEAKAIIIQDESVFDIIKKTNYNFKYIFTLNKFSEDIISRNKEYKIISIEEMIKLGFENSNKAKNSLNEIEQNCHPNDTATIIYTSGTSGRPKGVELTHQNLISQIVAIDIDYKNIINLKDDCVFSFLPLAHIFQRTVTYYFISKCPTFYFSNNIKTIADELERTKPSAVAVVPRFLEKVKNGLNEKIKNNPSPVQKFIATLCYRYAINHEPTKNHGIMFKLYDKILYSKIRTKLGGKIKAMISGGAALPDEVYRFFINIGVPIFQGYGLTETSPVVAVNTPTENKLYTIGKALKGVQVKLTPENELLVKGPNVMKGYYKIDNEGARVIDENGFLYTGDLASIDSEGYIKIIGRKKEQFKTSNGKFINPIKIESMLNAIPYIETSCVIAEGRPFVTVILFPNEAGALKIREVELSLPAYIRQINENLDRHEHIHYFYLHTTPASIDGGQITPSMKVIRNAIANQFKEQIDDFYSRKN
jgi:long-chain acyl-CoA synthetase